MTSWMRASCRSILLMTTIGLRLSSRAFFSTNRVCGIGPSEESTSRRTPSTILRTRSTSPPKSEWPGVSTMLILTPFHTSDMFLEMMVMPRSRSRSPESRMQSPIWSILRNSLHCRIIASTSVVFPWSTCAMIAMLRRSFLRTEALPSNKHGWRPIAASNYYYTLVFRRSMHRVRWNRTWNLQNLLCWSGCRVPSSRSPWLRLRRRQTCTSTL